ncbi:hypothetical protein HJC23_004752 [Cyclotella cryptica]|uniref:Molybdate-anion transporter n=1 Tax=Cyclotella cryptica TaxID=29204 RepID=A0ABD3PBV1_9STRA|eukprot:CCRYP_015878-RB/>CCRYP_015878-RB protein AED:0.03 eAED:0.03 QI:222/1/1/1/0.5/0.33/3/439/787
MGSPQQPSLSIAMIDEMIPSTSSISSPTVQRKNHHGFKPENPKGGSKTELKVHPKTTRRRSSVPRRGVIWMRALLICVVFLWIGVQFWITAPLTRHTSSLPLHAPKESAIGHTLLEGINAFISTLAFWFLPWNSVSRDKSGSPEHDILTYEQQEQQRIESDYVFIFNVLLCINMLSMIPSIVRWYSSKNVTYCESSSLDKDSELVIDNRQQNEQRLKNHDKQQQQLNDQQQRIIHQKLFYQTYLPPYLLATSADWLQGPYKYALYSSYGYTQRDIAHLFVVGYGSGMVLGSIVGGLADGYGRKRLCLCYCVAYALSVTCTHCRDYYVLLLGRVGGGVGTSLLFSVFESWLIGAHVESGLVGQKAGEGGGEKWLAESFSVGMYGSSLVAIASGVLANYIVGKSGKMRPLRFNDGLFHGATEDVLLGDEKTSLYFGGYIAAFDSCLPILMCCAALITILWEENYGESHLPEKQLDSIPATHKMNEPQPIDTENGVDIVTRKLDYGYLKKHSSIHKMDDDELVSNVTLQEVESQTNGHPPVPKTLHHHHEQQHKDGMFATLWNGMGTVWRSPRILMCCIIGSFFEGAMYIFIFLWTPALTSIQRTIQLRADNSKGEDTAKLLSKDSHGDVDELPFGWIFSTFMVCCMLGTITFSHLSNAGVSASRSLVWILALSALSCVAMAVPFTVHSNNSSGAHTVQYAGMLLYEFCIGAYYPAMGTVKGTIVPEDQRAAIYNVFRLPLNLMVLLYLVGDFDTASSFLANAAMLVFACFLQNRMVRGMDHLQSQGREL